jgi:4'-phosphopantetheinyl transferase
MHELRLYFNVNEWKAEEPELLRAVSGINEKELERIKKYHFKKHFKFTLIGRLLIRYAINELLKIDWDEIELCESLNNKPMLKNHDMFKNFDFNISHNGDLVCLVASLDTNVGIDTMKITNEVDVESFREQFTSFELKQIFENKDPILTFYRLWCLKESYTKSIGLGLNFDFNRVEFNVISSIISEDDIIQNTEVLVDKNKLLYTFDEQIILENHMVTVCRPGKTNEKNKFQEIKIHEIFNNLKALTAVSKDFWIEYNLKSE